MTYSNADDAGSASVEKTVAGVHTAQQVGEAEAAIEVQPPIRPLTDAEINARESAAKTP